MKKKRKYIKSGRYSKNPPPVVDEAPPVVDNAPPVIDEAPPVIDDAPPPPPPPKEEVDVKVPEVQVNTIEKSMFVISTYDLILTEICKLIDNTGTYGISDENQKKLAAQLLAAYPEFSASGKGIFWINLSLATAFNVGVAIKKRTSR